MALEMFGLLMGNQGIAVVELFITVVTPKHFVGVDTFTLFLSHRAWLFCVGKKCGAVWNKVWIKW